MNLVHLWIVMAVATILAFIGIVLLLWQKQKNQPVYFAPGQEQPIQPEKTEPIHLTFWKKKQKPSESEEFSISPPRL